MIAVEFDAGYVDPIARQFRVFFSPLNRNCTKTSLINKIAVHETEDIFCCCSMQSNSLQVVLCGPLWTCESVRGVKLFKHTKKLLMVLKTYSCKDLQAFLKIFKVNSVVIADVT